MKHILISLFISTAAMGQGNIVKAIYQDFLKYGTVYAAGDISNSYMQDRKEFDARSPYPGAGVWETPDIVDVTSYNPFDYRIGFGIRKLGRFDYERKPGMFWTGNQKREKQFALHAPSSAVDGLEYLMHWDTERSRGDTWTNHRYFIRQTGKNHIFKFEKRKDGRSNFQYESAEGRYRLPITKKLAISGGAIYRTHQTVYGYNPFEIWVNDGNPWYAMGYAYGYQDKIYTSTTSDPVTGDDVEATDWTWEDSTGALVAFTDLHFRETVFKTIINQYNNSIWDEIGMFGLVSPIVGFDFYHYEPKFWAHLYGSWLLPLHTYVQGDIQYSYLNRDNWGKGGLVEDASLQQWNDFQGGINIGWKLNKSFSIFAEGDYTKFWDRQIFQSTVGFNYTFK